MSAFRRRLLLYGLDKKPDITENILATNVDNSSGSNYFYYNTGIIQATDLIYTVFCDFTEVATTNAGDCICFGSSPASWNQNQNIASYMYTSSNKTIGYYLYKSNGMQSKTVNPLGRNKIAFKVNYNGNADPKGFTTNVFLNGALVTQNYISAQAIAANIIGKELIVSNQQGNTRSKLIYNKISVITGDVTDDYLIKLTAL